MAAVLPLLAAAAAALAVGLAAAASPWMGGVAAGLAVFATTSRRMLAETATEVVAATETDLPAARERLRWLAGRDATDLSAGEVRSAAVESAAENLADGLVAPLLAFALFAGLVPVAPGESSLGAVPISLAAGAGAAAWVKAVNTLDSMLGYPDKPHGTASARLDDAVMWMPARASAGLLALAAGAARAPLAARRWADAPPSPNSGWPMATLAAVLDARLEKPGVYVLNPDGVLPSVETSCEAVRVVGLAGVLAYLLAALLASLGGAVVGVAAATTDAGVVAWS
jgi:adenosylcobinamide-phosphate synthase